MVSTEVLGRVQLICLSGPASRESFLRRPFKEPFESSGTGNSLW